MTITLWDMDVLYELRIDCNNEGKDFIRIMPNSMQNDRIEDYDICLDKSQCEELIRCLNFIKEEI